MVATLETTLSAAQQNNHYTQYPRLISVVDVVITPMNPYQPILIRLYKSDEIAEEEKVFERKDRFSLKKTSILIV